MIRYLKQYKFLLFHTALFTAKNGAKRRRAACTPPFRAGQCAFRGGAFYSSTAPRAAEVTCLAYRAR